MRFAFLIVFSFLTITGFSQYTVTKVIGNVKKKTGEKVTVGSRLKETDVLVFSTPEDKVRVIITGKGIYVLTPSPKAAVEKSNLVEMLKSTLQMKSKEGYLSSRGQTIESVPDVFETIDSINSKNLIAKENFYLFDPGRYNVAGGGKFFIQTETAEGKRIMTELKTRADTLFIKPSNFILRDQDSYKLGFYDKAENRSREIADLDPYFDETGEMEKIIRVMIKENKLEDETLAQQACYEEVYESLGKPSDLLFENLYQKVKKGMKKTK